MKEDFSELIEYLNQKFERTATKEGVQVLRTEIDEKFVRAFEVFATKNDIRELTIRMDRVEESLHVLITSVDKLAKAVDDLRIEYSAITMQMNRHEKWIQQLAQKLGVKLEHE